MNTVDCVRERMEECYNKGFEIGKNEFREKSAIELAIKVLENDYPIDELAKIIEIPTDKLESEYEKRKFESR